MTQSTHLVLGGPGCGKTTRLLNILEEELLHNVQPTEIAFLTFTKAAAREARDRAALRFHFDPEKDMPWFRTIHSLAYAQLGMTRDEIMDRKDWVEFGVLVGEVMTGSYSTEEGLPPLGRETGDVMLRIVDYAATAMLPLEGAWRLLDEVVDWHRLRRFSECLTHYKDDCGKVDFGDLLTTYVREGNPIARLKVGIIDEAQDLTAAQWAAAWLALRECERIYIAGDDDQAIYQWAGADIDKFLHLNTNTREVLPVSHRLSPHTLDFASALARRIGERYAKPFTAGGTGDEVSFYQRLETVDIAGTPGTWFLLARNNYFLTRIEAIVREMGVNYMRRSGPAVRPEDVDVIRLWERVRTKRQDWMTAKEGRALRKALGMPAIQMKELQKYSLLTLDVPDFLHMMPWYDALAGISADRRDYYVTCLRRGQKLSVPPRIRIETIHGVKGAEADHVALLTDLSSKTMRSYRKLPDNEHRVFYVGATRARQGLHIVMPQSDQFYPIEK